MRRIVPSWLLSVVPIVGGCVCSEDTLAEVSGPPAAKIVRRSTVSLEIEGQGHFFAFPTGLEESHANLLVVGKGRARLPDQGWTSETRPELVAASDGERLAYRGPGADWRVVYARGGHHVFLAGDTRSELAWDQVPDFFAAAPSLYGAATLNKQSCVVEEVTERGEVEKLSAFFTATVDVVGGEEWEKAFRALPAEAQAPITVVLDQRLRDGSGIGLERALSVTALDDEARVPLLGRAIQRMLDNPENSNERGGLSRLSLARKALRTLTTHRPEDGADVACKLLGRFDDAAMESTALFALFRAKKGCDKADEQLEKELCTPRFACLLDPTSRSHCAKLEDALIRRLETVGPADPIPADKKALLAAWATVVQETPARLVRARARAGYAIDEAKDACAGTPAGKPCRCDGAAVRSALCSLSDGRGETVACNFRVDDEKARITDVVSAFDGRMDRVWLGPLHSETRLCGIDAAKRVHCASLTAPLGAGLYANRPKIIESLEGAHALAIASDRVCAAIGDGVRCIEPTAKDSKVQEIDLGGRVEDLAVASGGRCGLRASGTVACAFNKALKGGPIDGLDDVARIYEGDGQMIAEKKSGQVRRVACGSDRCNVMDHSARDLTKLGKLLDRGAVGDRGCVLDARGGIHCWTASGEPFSVMDQARAIAVSRAVDDRDKTLAVTVLTDGIPRYFVLEAGDFALAPLFR